MSQREIALDTETTGLDPDSGHRVVEIGCVEMINGVATGNVYHCYINPERDMPEEAQAVHGLSAEFLSDKPVFNDQVDAFMDFVGQSRLVIHNAAFDMKFLNAELRRAGRPILPDSQALDTVQLARDRFPGARASLDALCKRFGIDLSERSLHGALLDANLLAQVYLELCGGRQQGLELAKEDEDAANGAEAAEDRPYRPARPHAASTAELQTHAEFLAKIKDPLWAATQGD